MTPLKSVLLKNWSPEHLEGHDLNGGATVSFRFDPSVIGTGALSQDPSQWNTGDIATLLIDAETQRAHLRFVTPRHYIVRTRDFRIVQITHEGGEPTKTEEDSGRHIFLQGEAENGAVYIMPMLGYTAWESEWDLKALEDRLNKACEQTLSIPAATRLSFENKAETFNALDPSVKLLIEHYKDIFYSTSKHETPFDTAKSITTTTFALQQTGPGTRARMFAAAFVKKPKPSAATFDLVLPKRGTAFSPPYFEVDGEKVFIRTSA